MVPAMFVVGLFCCLNPFATATATTVHGGAIYVGKGSLYTMNGGEISKSSASYGGGVMVVGGNFLLKDGTIYDNSATMHGGALYLWKSAQTTMSGGTIRNNTATSYGGGVEVNDNSTLNFNGGYIKNNSSSEIGGGIDVGANSSLTITSGEISGNTSKDGGGIYIDNTSSATMTGGSIFGNTATSNGSNIFNIGSFTMSGGIIGVKGTVASDSSIYNAGNFYAYGGNIFDNISSSGTIYVKNSASISGKILLLNENSKIIVEEWNGVVPALTIKPYALDKVFMILKGGDSEPDLSTLTINGFTLSNKIYLKSEKNSDGNWEICVSERVSNVSFNPGKGTCETESISVDYEAAYGTLPTPYLRGYKFTGWSRNYFTLASYTGSYQAKALGGKITLTPEKTNTRAAFQIQMWNNDSLVETNGGTMMWAESTGHFSEVFTKTEELKQIYFRLNADADDAYVIYDIQDLVNGHTYVVSLDVIEHSVNKIVVQNIMIEENSKNIETTYTSSYVTETTINDQLYNHTLFAKYKEATVKVVVANLSGTKTEGTVMGTNFATRSYTKKLDETITISYRSRGTYTFAKVVKGTTFDSPEITDLDYKITEDDLIQETIYFTICYVIKVNLYSSESTAGQVGINGGTMSSSATENIPYVGTSTALTLNAQVTASNGCVFSGWFENPACYGIASYLTKDYTFTNSDIKDISGNINLWAKFSNIRDMSGRYGRFFGKDWFEVLKNNLPGSLSNLEKNNIETIQFRTEESLTTQQSDGRYSSHSKCIHGKEYTEEGNLDESYTGIKFKTCMWGKCIIFYSSLQISADQDMSSCFAGMESLSSIIFENFNTKYTNNMSDMFNGDSRLSSLDLSCFNTYRVINFDRMFYGCGTMTRLNLSNFEIRCHSTVVDMFTSCGPIRRFYTPKVCEKTVDLNTEMYDYSEITLKDVDLPVKNGPYTALPQGDMGSRYWVPSIDSKKLKQYVEITSDMLSDIVDLCECPSGAEVKFRFDYYIPALWFNGENISVKNSSGTWVYQKTKAYYTDIGNVFEITLVPDDDYYFLSLRESELFSTLNTALNKKKIKLIGLTFVNACTDAMQDMSSFFKNCSDLEYIDGLQNLHFQNVRKVDSMFEGCSNLQKIVMANCEIRISKATRMFYDCENITIIDLGNIRLGNGTELFSWCDRLLLIIMPICSSIVFGEDETGFIYADGSTVTTVDSDKSLAIIKSSSSTSAISSNKSERLELSKFFNNFSVFAMVCVSALAYPFMNDKKRKENF